MDNVIKMWRLGFIHDPVGLNMYIDCADGLYRTIRDSNCAEQDHLEIRKVLGSRGYNCSPALGNMCILSHGFRVSIDAGVRTRGDVFVGHYDVELYEDTAKADRQFPWSSLPANIGVEMGLGKSVTAQAAFATWNQALQGHSSEDSGEVAQGFEGSSRAMADFLRDPLAAALCNTIMTASDQQCAAAQGMPLPVSEIRTNEAGSKFAVMVAQIEGKRIDFEAMAVEWNHSVLVGIAHAVKVGARELEPIFMTDRFRLSQHWNMLLDREKGNAQFEGSRDDYAHFNKSISASNKEHCPAVSPALPGTNPTGGKAAPQLQTQARVRAHQAPPAQATRTKRAKFCCTKCGHPRKGHPRSGCPAPVRAMAVDI